MKSLVDGVVAQAARVVLGKERPIRLALACLLARGHLLIEDQPGVGKTTLAQVLAISLGLDFKRVQFTSDLLPSDILGLTVYDPKEGFSFRPGPVFAQVLLADEINRATPKTQSALLEAMAEGQVSIEGHTHLLPEPFFVIATQNPTCQVGTFPLPESQLDRFLMRLALGYPERAAERALLQGADRRLLLKDLQPVMSPVDLVAAQREAQGVHASDAVLDYVQGLLEFSRQSHRFASGLSPRAGLALLACARAWAFMGGRDHVLPEDVQAVLPGAAGHRLQVLEGAGGGGEEVMTQLTRVPVP